MKVVVLFIEIFLFVCLDSGAALASLGKAEWRIETEYKFQLGYYRSDEENARFQSEFGSSVQKVMPLDLKGPGIPELDIPVKLSVDRGFALPFKGDPKDLTYYMKLFHYPVGLNAAISAGSMVNAFLLNHSAQGRELENFTNSSANVIVKVGSIRRSDTTFEKQPFPDFILPATTGFLDNAAVSPQEFFDSALFYSTVGISSVVPAEKTVDDQIKINASTVGLQNFLRDMTEVYASNFSEIGAANKSANERFFVAREACIGQFPEECRLVVYRIPKQVLVFKDARSKPRPMGPKGSFASGFVMIQRTEYYQPKTVGTIEIPTLAELNSKWKHGPSRILEAVSLVQF
jgi:hypothetical protein